MANVTKSFDGKKYRYFFNGNVFRTSTRNYKYAAIAKVRECERASKQYWGYESVIALGNEPESTRRSNAIKVAEYCDIYVVEIQ